MTHDQKAEIDTATTERKSWNTPELRAVAPARQTAGGPFGIDDQDDAFYALS